MAYYRTTNNPIATFGEKSQSTLDLQRRLNKEYGAGLAEDSMFGPKTQAAYDRYLSNQGSTPRRDVPDVTTPTPQAEAPAESPRNIDLSGIGGQPQYQNADEYYSAVYGNTPSFEDVYQKERANVQDVIDSVNAAYAGRFAREETRGLDRSGATRALSARGGTLGSSFGNADKAKTEDFNEEAMQALEAEKQAQIGAILSKARNIALGRYEQETALAQKKGDDFLAYKKEQQEGLRNDIKTIANQGVYLDDLDDEQYKDLFEGAGFDSQLAFESYYNENLPKAEQPDYFIEEIIKGKDGNAQYRRAYMDPATGQPVVKNYDLGYEYNEQDADRKTKVVTLDNGNSLLLDTQTGETIKYLGGAEPKAPTTNELKPTFIQFLKTGIDPTTGEQIGGARGSDGYSDPDVYVSAFEAWDGTTNEFLKLFPVEDYVNPLSYQYLPAAIQPEDAEGSASGIDSL
jgi:hypothetical protein